MSRLGATLAAVAELVDRAEAAGLDLPSVSASPRGGDSCDGEDVSLQLDSWRTASPVTELHRWRGLLDTAGPVVGKPYGAQGNGHYEVEGSVGGARVQVWCAAARDVARGPVDADGNRIADVEGVEDVEP